jgi:hypothetical protein
MLDKIKSYSNKIITSGKQQLSLLESILTLLQQQGVNLTASDKSDLNIKTVDSAEY